MHLLYSLSVDICICFQINHLRSFIQFRFSMGIIDNIIAKCKLAMCKREVLLEKSESVQRLLWTSLQHFIDGMQKWPPTNYSFVFVLISLTSLVRTSKIERIWAVKRGWLGYITQRQKNN